mgnify:CR=1 FL=1
MMNRNWIGGILYYNPSDPHTMVEQRVGIGTTVKYGHIPRKRTYYFQCHYDAFLPSVMHMADSGGIYSH